MEHPEPLTLDVQAPPVGTPVLVADIGGTNARFALARADRHGRPHLLADSLRIHPTAAFPGLADAVRHYLADVAAAPAQAVFAVAGPVIDDAVHMTNCPWHISAPLLRAELGLRHLRLVNDFHAMARCLPLLAPADVELLGAIGPAVAEPAPPPHAQRFAVLGPGTGLGVAGLVWSGATVVVHETEGGHIGFAPMDALEIEVLKVLMQRFGRVSVERLLSGPGLVALHQALGEVDGRGPGVDIEGPGAISVGAATGDADAVRTARVFCRILGSVAGDLALVLRAFDGVHLAGGLVPHLLPWLREPGFRQRFEDKGRFAGVLASTPTVAIVHPQPGLLGLAAIASDPGPGR